MTTSTASVALALGTGAGSGTLSGTSPRAAVNGVATFNDLSINNAATYTLVATSAGFTQATSDSFSVSAATPFVSSMTPIGASVGQGSTPMTITGSNFTGVTDVQFFTGANDAGIVASGVTPSGDGTSLTLTVNFTGTALTGGHSVRMTKGGTVLNTSGSLQVYSAGSVALYTRSIAQADRGSTTNGVTITGLSLTSVTSVVLNNSGGGQADPAITFNITSQTATQIVGNLIVGNGALIGSHNFGFLTAGNPVNTNGVVQIRTASGETMSGMNPQNMLRNATTPFTINGSNMGAVTGIAFANPDGSADASISVTGFAGGASSLTGSAVLGANVAIGPRRIVLTLPGNVQLISSFYAFVQETGAIGVSSINPSTSSPGFNTFNFSLNGVNLGTATGFKFQVNGIDDTSITLGTFVLGSSSISAPASVAANAALGVRNVVLLLPGGAVPTTLTVTVQAAGGGGGGGGGTQVFDTVSPLGGLQNTNNISLTITGTNLTGVNGLKFKLNGTASTALTATSVVANGAGTQVTATLSIAANAVAGQCQVVGLVNGNDATSNKDFNVYAAGSPGIFTFTPPRVGCAAML